MGLYTNILSDFFALSENVSNVSSFFLTFILHKKLFLWSALVLGDSLIFKNKKVCLTPDVKYAGSDSCIVNGCTVLEPDPAVLFY